MKFKKYDGTIKAIFLIIGGIWFAYESYKVQEAVNSPNPMSEYADQAEKMVERLNEQRRLENKNR